MKAVDVGKRIKGLRVGADLNQTQVGEFVQRTAATVSDWEKGKRIPDGESLLRLANLFGVHAAWVLDGTGPQRLADVVSEASEGPSEKEIDTELLREILRALKSESSDLSPERFADAATEAYSRCTGTFRKHVGDVVKLVLKG